MARGRRSRRGGMFKLNIGPERIHEKIKNAKTVQKPRKSSKSTPHSYPHMGEGAMVCGLCFRQIWSVVNQGRGRPFFLVNLVMSIAGNGNSIWAGSVEFAAGWNTPDPRLSAQVGQLLAWPEPSRPSPHPLQKQRFPTGAFPRQSGFR